MRIRDASTMARFPALATSLVGKVHEENGVADRPEAGRSLGSIGAAGAGGLGVSTILTLVLVPAIYEIVYCRQQRAR